MCLSGTDGPAIDVAWTDNEVVILRMEILEGSRAAEDDIVCSPLLTSPVPARESVFCQDLSHRLVEMNLNVCDDIDSSPTGPSDLYCHNVTDATS